MATQGSKGNRKKNSKLQKAHYDFYKSSGRRISNKIKKLQTRIRRNAAEIRRKANRTPPRIIKVDSAAVNRLKALTNK